MICEPHGYDDEELIDLLADGRATYQQIAERLGIEARTVAAIARGSQRPELQEEVERASVELLRQAHRLARAYSRGLVSTMIQEAIAPKTDEEKPVARKAREFLLDRLLPKGPSGEVWGTGSALPAPPAAVEERPLPDLPGLTSEELEWIARRHDRPEPPTVEDGQ